MDILRPSLIQQVAPAPWLVARNNVNAPQLIRRVLTQEPGASVDDIVRQLSAWGVQMSGIIVSMWMPKSREQEVAVQILDEQSSAVVVSPQQEIEASCNCARLPCTCCEPTPAWWHQHCCELLASEEQADSPDEVYEHANSVR